MSSPSNLYAEKIYAEQPIALWALDDECSFASFFSTANLQLESWTRSGGTSFETVPENTDPYPKISSTNFTKLITSGNVTLTSPNTFSSSENFSAGLWINPQSAITSVTFTVGSLTKTFSMSGIEDQWTYLDHIFELSSAVSSQNFVITIATSTAATVYLNGFSIGIGQNLSGTETVGSQIVSAPLSLYGVEATQYGLGENSGWYVGNNSSKKMYATNSAVPLVYGADNCTTLTENSSGPSLIVPGMGFLNESGQKQILTFEAWLRIKADGSSQTNPFRIIGPVDSTDGLYVNGQHLILKVDGEYSSHYVGEWFRPMLVNIEYTKEKISLFVNGELATSLVVTTPAFPDTVNDYIGFYVGENVLSMDVDCVAVYPYRMTPAILKRRFGYGQAVSLPSEIETAYSGKQIQIDYTFAGYSSDYSYPKIESWSSSTKENVYTNKNVMGSPRLVKPNIILSNDGNIETWESDQAALNVSAPDTYPYIKMTPNESWSNTSGYLYLPSMRIQGLQKIKSIFVVCEANSSFADKDQVVFKIQNKDNLDTITAILSGTSLSYVYNISGNQGTLTTKTVSSGSKFVAGIDFMELLSSTTLASYIRRFLMGRSRLAVYVGGDYAGSDSEISTTFMGKIYKFGISSASNYSKESMSTLYTSGYANVSDTSSFMSKNPSYGFGLLLQSFIDEDLYSLETSANSYWQDYIPLSKFAKKAPSSELYVTDMIQFSIDAAESLTVSSGNISSSSTDVRTFIYFDYVTNTSALSSFRSGLTVVPLGYEKVVDAKSVWSGKAFEVVDGAIIFPPQSGFASGKSQKDLVMITLVEMKTKSTDKLPIKIRSIEYAAQTFSRATDSTFNHLNAKKIGTRTQSAEVFMYSETDGVYSYSSYNPVAISKTMTPYLYLTNKSGIKVLDSYSTSNDRGIYMQVNHDSAEQYFISLMSMYLLYNDGDFPEEMTIAEVYDRVYTKLRIVAQATSDASVAKIKVLNQLGDELSNIEYYVNGTYTTTPTITSGNWSNIGILFVSNPLDMSNTSQYKIELVGSMLINNLSYYQLRPEELAQQVLPNEWNDYDTENHWQDIDTEETWATIAASESFVRPELSPVTISNIYNGTNRILASADNDSTGFTLQDYEYDIINEIVWQNPVTITT